MPQSTRRSPIIHRLRSGLWWGLSFATVYSVWVLGIWLVRGNATFERLGITLLQVVAAYFISGAVGGLTVGLLMPLGQTPLGAAILGFIVAVQVFAAVAISMEGWPINWLLVLGPSIAIGPGAGIGMLWVNQWYP